jgi:hypothetical protein
MSVGKDETLIVGTWKLVGGKLVADEACERIAYLVKSYLVKVSTDVTGWDFLYKDPQSGKYWELTYPQSELHGGGPPKLEMITVEAARGKYRFPQVD